MVKTESHLDIFIIDGDSRFDETTTTIDVGCYPGDDEEDDSPVDSAHNLEGVRYTEKWIR